MATRRRLLAVAAGALAATAGCAGSGSGDPTTTPATRVASLSGSRSTDGLDLREANVTAVEAERETGGYRFDVTLYHDDDGEDGYADWWQVESLDGDRLGRRDLTHAHGTREFTRSATVDVGEADCVIVRGHDATHGYGGVAAAVDLLDESVTFVDGGTRRATVDSC
jgi:hypothetical protein